jgi:hypothetical protein
MAVFNAAQAFGKTSSQDYGYLVDALSVMENQLSSDGKLSPADLKILKQKATQIYSAPGLSPSQRSNVLVKISGYDKQSALFNVEKSKDLTSINNNVKNDLSTAVMAAGNSPLAFMTLKQQILENKINQLSSVIDQEQSSGVEGDVSGYMNELSSTNSEYQDTLQAINDIKTYAQAPSGKPSSDFVAYATTNSKGEIIDLNIEREGNKTGFYETNGMYGGLKLYGKANRKDGDNVVFRIGGDEFKGTSAGSFITTDQGTFQNLPKLVSTKTTQGKQFGIIKPGDTYVDVAPNTVKVQQYIPDGGWAKGVTGNLYQRNGDSYTQHAPTENLDQLGAKDFINIPQDWENNVRSSVTENTTNIPDINAPISSASTSPTTLPSTAPVSTSTQSQKTAPVSVGMSRISAPTVRAPQSASGQAVNLLGQAKGFFSNLFAK